MRSDSSGGRSQAWAVADPFGADRTRGADFYGLRADQLQTALDYWTSQGCWPVSLSASTWNGRVYFAGSFQRGPVRPVRHLLYEDAYKAEVVRLEQSGYRPERVSVVQTGAGIRFTTIWVIADGPFVHRWGMAPGEFEQVRQDLSGKGYRLADIHPYQDGGLRLAATWVSRADQAAAEAWFGLTAQEFGDRSRSLRRSGLYPTRLVLYPDAWSMRYAALWETGRGESTCQADMTGPVFWQRHLTFGARGFRLHHIQPYGSRLAAIWGK